MSLAQWGLDLPTWGATEYFEGFFDYVPYEGMHSNSALNDVERTAIQTIHEMMVSACDATPSDVSERDLIASGWPRRIGPIASEALALMQARGRFSEEAEEDTPP